MKTKIIMLIILAAIIANTAFTQQVTNPKLTNTNGFYREHLLIVDAYDVIQVSDKRVDDLENMEKDILGHETIIKQQQETINVQQKEIDKLKSEIKDLKADIKTMGHTISDLKRKVDEIEKIVRK